MTISNAGKPANTSYYSANLAVFIGRFQPLHNGHLAVIDAALTNSDYLLVLVGSSDQPRDYFNPFTFPERRKMILASLPESERHRVLVLPLLDWTYNNAQWVVDVQDAVNEAKERLGLNEDARVMLVGHAKDHTSFYLKLFPQWFSMEVPNHKGLSATPMRERLFNASAMFEQTGEILPDVPPAVIEFITLFSRTDAFRNMIEEYKFVEEYKKPYASLPYKPIFTTVDACVVQSGHVLLVQRRSRPGHGLLALPGGFLEAHEWVDDAVIRELREETRLKVPEPVLRGSIVTQRKFDAPYRSARGRTITFATLFHLAPAIELPKVKGQESEVLRVKWWPLADVKRSMMMEDHYHIIMNLTANI